jgi:hypothetical protein
MANGLWLVPVETKVAAGNRQIRRDGQFFAAPGSQQGAIIANAQAKALARGAAGPPANFRQQGKLTRLTATTGLALFHMHL